MMPLKPLMIPIMLQTKPPIDKPSHLPNLFLPTTARTIEIIPKSKPTMESHQKTSHATPERTILRMPRTKAAINIYLFPPFFNTKYSTPPPAYLCQVFMYKLSINC